jgi:hypothetical protein
MKKKSLLWSILGLFVFLAIGIFFALGSVEPASTNGTVAIVTFSATASTNNASVELIKDKVVASVKGAQKGIVAVNNTKIAISQ